MSLNAGQIARTCAELRSNLTLTGLTPMAKVKARMWFRLRKAPRHDFSAV